MFRALAKLSIGITLFGSDGPALACSLEESSQSQSTSLTHICKAYTSEPQFAQACQSLPEELRLTCAGGKKTWLDTFDLRGSSSGVFKGIVGAGTSLMKAAGQATSHVWSNFVGHKWESQKAQLEVLSEIFSGNDADSELVRRATITKRQLERQASDQPQTWKSLESLKNLSLEDLGKVQYWVGEILVSGSMAFSCMRPAARREFELLFLTELAIDSELFFQFTSVAKKATSLKQLLAEMNSTQKIEAAAAKTENHLARFTPGKIEKELPLVPLNQIESQSAPLFEEMKTVNDKLKSLEGRIKSKEHALSITREKDRVAVQLANLKAEQGALKAQMNQLQGQVDELGQSLLKHLDAEAAKKNSHLYDHFLDCTSGRSECDEVMIRSHNTRQRARGSSSTYFSSGDSLDAVIARIKASKEIEPSPTTGPSLGQVVTVRDSTNSILERVRVVFCMSSSGCGAGANRVNFGDILTLYPVCGRNIRGVSALGLLQAIPCG
jgi:hypothetical protein